MRASARIVASSGVVGSGVGVRRTRLTVLRGEAPLLPRQTGPATVHLVGGAAGPLGGDRLRLDVHVEAGAELTVRSVAATLALPGPHGALSRLAVHATVEAGGRLIWEPEPLIAAARCRHETVSTVEVAVGGSLVWREELVCGRHGEEPGDVRLHTTVRLDGLPLHVSELAVGPSAPGWDGPAVLGGARVYGSVLRVPALGALADAAAEAEAELATDDHDNPASAIMELAGSGSVTIALGDDLPDVRRRLDRRHGHPASSLRSTK
jgi:urease accessory protein